MEHHSLTQEYLEGETENPSGEIKLNNIKKTVNFFF